eukprot:gene14718-16248_t
MLSSQEVPKQNVTEQDREPEDNNEEMVAEKVNYVLINCDYNRPQHEHLLFNCAFVFLEKQRFSQNGFEPSQRIRNKYDKQAKFTSNTCAFVRPKMASNFETPQESGQRATDTLVPDEPDKSELFLSALTKMKNSLDENNAVLTQLLERSGPPPGAVHGGGPSFKRYRLDSVSDSAQPVATPAAQSAPNLAAQSAHIFTAQSENYAAPSATPSAQSDDHGDDPLAQPPPGERFRSSEEDALSLYGGPDFEHQDNNSVIDNTELLENIDHSLLLTDEAGPPVSDKLGKILNSKFPAEFDPEKRKELLSKYKVPSNCESFHVPKVNPEIRQKLNAHAKRCDMSLYTQQDTLLRVTSAISSVVDNLLSARQKNETPDYQSLIAQIIDSVALLGHVNRELSFKRRDLLRTNLGPEFKQACSRNMKIGKFLFGADLSQVIQQIRSTNRLVNSFANSSPQSR